MLWAELRQRPATLPGLLVCAVVLVLHQHTHVDWFIDDAAICFAYARNLAMGEGAVPWPGGERVEAISDPLWVLLLTAFQALSLDGFAVAKPLGMVFGVASLVQAWRLARHALPGHPGDGALLAPALLALNAQFAIWCASGLENGLFGFLLATLLERTAAECRSRVRFPGAATAALLLTWTRPEGIAYAAMAGGWLLASGAARGRVGPAVRFAAVVALPSAALELLRLWYFAWPLPNPFYAKIASRGVVPLQWDSRGWWQLREWSARLWHVYYLPLYAVGLVGWSRGGLVAVAVLATSLLLPLPATLQGLIGLPPLLPDPPSTFVAARLVALAVAFVALPLLGRSARGGHVTGLSGHAIAVGLLFSVYANGDWMGGYRFLSLVAVPLAVVLAVGLTRSLDALERRVSGHATWRDAGVAAAVVALGAWFAPNASQTRDHLRFNVDETTASVKQRVDHTREVLRTTFWTEPVTTIEVDQGAHLWWAPDYRSLDMGMLVDIPMARHWFQQRAFVEEYVYTEHRPTFAHVTGWWARHSGLRTYPPFERGDYVELPPYTDLRTGGPYPGVFVHRELIVASGGASEARAPVWMPGAPGYLELPLPARHAPDTLTLELVDEDGAMRARFELAVGYGLLAPADARPGEGFRNRFAVEVPVELPSGTTVTARAGDLALDVEIVDEAGRARAIGGTRDALAAHASDDACEAAETDYVWVERHRPTDWTWHATRPGRGDDRARIAACFARRAERAPRDAAVDALERAHRWDHHHPELRRVGGALGATLWRQGEAARRAGDWDVAYARYASLLRFQPWRAWARRYAEEARDHRLGLTGDVRLGIGGADDPRHAPR